MHLGPPAKSITFIFGMGACARERMEALGWWRSRRRFRVYRHAVALDDCWLLFCDYCCAIL
eukprot:6210721-Pyramimonas_sp.AAC.1